LNRRDLLILGSTAIAWPRAARAQQQTRPRQIAWLGINTRMSAMGYVEAFREGMRALGYGDEDIAIEGRWADAHAERLPDLAVELVRLAPEVIFAPSLPAARAAQQATATIPIVVVFAGNLVDVGLVASLAHPGGNITGVSNIISADLVGKRLELLKTAVPHVERIAVMGGSLEIAFTVAGREIMRQAAQNLRVELVLIEAGTLDEIEGAFATMARERADAVMVGGNIVYYSQISRIVELVASHNLPAIYWTREFVMAGGLMSYGTNSTALYRRTAAFVDKILKGAKPADLPVEQPTKFELVFNSKTARALGRTIPPLILAGADEVIE
jgi:putative tryptophan/tyrosine transport system substrate-binding protein